MNLSQIKNWPLKPGVYLMMNPCGRVIYIGKAKNLKNRLRSYFTKQSTGFKTQFLKEKVSKLDYILTHTEAQALLLEAELIKKHRPRYNIRLKDDKACPYIRLSIKDEYPRFYLERKVKKDGHLYFGPYSGGSSARNMMRFLNENYKIRDCSNHFMKSRKTPCLIYDIGHCTAPCTKKVNYKKQISKALLFLRGRALLEVKKLEKQMEQAAEKEKFEQALVIKNRLLSIRETLEKQEVVLKSKKNLDVFSYFEKNGAFSFEILHIRQGRLIGHSSHFEPENLWPQPDILGFLIQFYMENLIPSEIGVHRGLLKTQIQKLKTAFKHISGRNIQIQITDPKQKLRPLTEMAYKNAKEHLEVNLKKSKSLEEGLLEIKKLFRMKNLPRRIECYDVSHLQSHFVYASQVVFEDGKKKPADFRLYKLKSKNDDCASMREALKRRLKHKEQPMPDLILVDGGRGQLASALRVLKKSGVHAAAIAKNKPSLKSQKAQGGLRFKDQFYIEGRKNGIFIHSSKKSFQILAGARDEAHRFARLHYEKTFRKKNLSSRLDLIPGIGKKRKIRLLKEFKTLHGILKAGEEEAALIIGQAAAKKLILALKKENRMDPS